MNSVPRPRIRLPAIAAIAAIVAIAMAAAMNVGQVMAQESPEKLRASISVASDYVLNGLAQTQGNVAARLSIDYEHDSGFFAGGSLNNVDYAAEARFATPRDRQLILYTGYVWRGPRWQTNAVVSRYRYPGISRNYDYSQLAVTASYRGRYFLTAARIGNLLSIYDDAHYYRAGFALPWLADIEFEANAGVFRTGNGSENSYDYWDIGLSRPAGRFALDLRFHDNTYGETGLLGNDDSSLWVFSVSYSFLPIGRNRD